MGYRLQYKDGKAIAFSDDSGTVSAPWSIFEHATITGIAEHVHSNDIDLCKLYPEYDINICTLVDLDKLKEIDHTGWDWDIKSQHEENEFAKWVDESEDPRAKLIKALKDL